MGILGLTITFINSVFTFKKWNGFLAFMSCIFMVCFIGLSGYLSDTRGVSIKPDVLKNGHIYDIIVVTNNYAVVKLHSENEPGILLKLQHPEKVVTGKSYILTKLSGMPDGVIWTDMFEETQVSKK